jgi:hypothetical protein
VKWIGKPKPPEEPGRLVTFTRGDGIELRVSMAEYEGRPYVALRVWERGSDGEWYPVKGRGCSVRLGECDQLGAALQRVAKEGEQRQPKGKRPGWAKNLPPVPRAREEFTELEDAST